MSATRNDFEEDDFQALAEVLYLGEEVPDHLQPLWEYVGTDPLALARLEDRRMWCAAMGQVLEIAQSASLVLAVSLAAAMQVQVESQTGWIRRRQRLAIGPSGPTGVASGAASTVEFESFIISLERGPTGVEVTLLSEELGVEGIGVEVLDAEGQSIVKSTTDASGLALLPIPETGEFKIQITWPVGSRPGRGREPS